MIQRSLYAASARNLPVLAAGLFLALCFGLVAGHSPLIALGGVAGILIAVLMFKDLTTAIMVFTVGSFAEILSAGSAASAAKALGGLLLLVWVAALAHRRVGEVRGLLREHRSLVACAIALLAWSLLSAVWAESRSTALTGSLRWAEDLMLFPILYTGLRRVTDVRRVMAAFIGGALLAGLYGVVSGNNVDGSRLTGALGNPNETAAVLVAAAALALVIAGGEHLSRLRRRIAVAAAVGALVGLAATASRGGAIAVALSAITAIALGGRWRRPIAIAGTSGATLLVVWFIFLAPAYSQSHITSTSSPRSTTFLLAERAIAANPVVGVGNNNFILASKNYLVRPGVTTGAAYSVTTPMVAHDLYLEIWADLGVVGLLLFAGLVLGCLRAAWAAVKTFEEAGCRSEELLARGLVIAVAATLAADLFMSDLYSKQIFLLLALCPALLAAARAQVSRSPAARTQSLA